LIFKIKKGGIMGDLREFLDKLKDINDLVVIDDEIDWYVEAGAIMRRANEVGGPAQLFTNIKGSEKGSRLAGGILSTYRRLAIAMDIDPQSGYHDILKEYIDRRSNPIKPIIVNSGPCKENIMIGDNIDLLKFPIPHLHPSDGNRFIGTLNIGICKDLESDWINWGMYRAMVHDKRTTGIYMGALNHGGIILKKYWDKGLKMDYAIAIGSDPLAYLVSSSGVPYGMNEVDVIGGLKREPVQLVKCETNELYVPADSEIVIEGEISPGEIKSEGPFGEYPGYSVSGRVERPILNIKAITYRNNPILTSTCLGTPTDEGHILWSVACAADIWIDLKRVGLPVTGIYIPPESGLHAVVVSTKTPHFGIPSLISSIVWTNRNGMYYPKVFVVNDDVDPTNMKEVFHAFSTKCNPAYGISIDKRAINCPLTPYLPPDRRDQGIGGANVLFDCTWPVEWKEEEKPALMSFKSAYPEPVRKKVISNWEKWGF
jgi:4-hydroxy-3-polyprenylbenzoate decarboxylase